MAEVEGGYIPLEEIKAMFRKDSLGYFTCLVCTEPTLLRGAYSQTATGAAQHIRWHRKRGLGGGRYGG